MNDNIFKSQQKNELLSPLLPVYYTTENEYSNEDIEKPLFLDENIENTKKTNIYKITNFIENENKTCSSPHLSKSPINNKFSLNNLNILSSKNDNNIIDISNLISTFSYDGIKLFQDMKMETFNRNDNRIFKILKDNKSKGRIKKNL